MILILNRCTFLEGVTPNSDDDQLAGTFAATVCNKGITEILNQSTFLEGSHRHVHQFEKNM
jgi:hypothetical protein